MLRGKGEAVCKVQGIWTDPDVVWDVDYGGLMEPCAHWCHLANATEPSICGADAALRQSNYFDHSFAIKSSVTLGWAAFPEENLWRWLGLAFLEAGHVAQPTALKHWREKQRLSILEREHFTQTPVHWSLLQDSQGKPAPDNHASTLSLNFFTGRMLFLTPN